MSIVNIDTKLLKKSNIEPYYFFVLNAIYQEAYDLIEIIIYSDKTVLKTLEQAQYIKILGEDPEDIEFRKRGYDLFEEEKINFDEFWDNFPVKTPSGRSLRAEHRTWHNKLTSDYIKCKKKYLSRIKTIQEHENIIKILLAKGNKASMNDREYENGIETYINQQKWQRDEKYLDQDAFSLGGKSI